MNIIPVDNVGQFGIITDLPPQEMPLNAWSSGRNIRMRDGYVEKFTGHIATFGAPLMPAYWSLGVPIPAGYNWLYAGLNEVCAWNGTTHVDITRLSGPYSANATLNWTGGLLGGLPVISNGVDVPQMWNLPAGATRLQDLVNWPSGVLAGSIRPFKQFLVACNIVKATVRHRHMVKWSHPADPGFLPVTWDETDETFDAGEYTLSESAGTVLDSIPLRDVNIIYKEDEVWGQQYVGGLEVFRFFNIFRNIGALSRRCATEIFSGTHAVFGVNDVVTHNGQSAESILDGRAKRRLYSSMNGDAYQTSFIASNFADREVWFCYPEAGHSLPNIALVWNYFTKTISFRDLPDATHIEPGIIDLENTADIWSTADGTWGDWLISWGAREFNPSRKALIILDPLRTKIHKENSTEQFNGIDMEASVERIGLGLPLTAGKPPNFTTEKFLSRLWPRIEGTEGGIIEVTVGTQEKVGGPVTWRIPQEYTIGTSNSVEPMVTSAMHAVRFASNTDITWKLHGYDCEVRAAGRYYGG